MSKGPVVHMDIIGISNVVFHIGSRVYTLSPWVSPLYFSPSGCILYSPEWGGFITPPAENNEVLRIVKDYRVMFTLHNPAQKEFYI